MEVFMAKPVFHAFTTREYGEDQDRKTFWRQIGSVFPHKGFDVILDALPIDGRIVLLEPQPKEKDGAE
jgi:hypothetical protein